MYYRDGYQWSGGAGAAVYLDQYNTRQLCSQRASIQANYGNAYFWNGQCGYWVSISFSYREDLLYE